MQPATLVELSDVSDRPKVKIMLPLGQRIGDKIRLSFTLDRQNGGRYEVLEVEGEFRVAKTSTDAASQGPLRGLPFPVVELESTGVAPAWRAVKRPKEEDMRVVPPAVSPRTVVEPWG